MDFIIQKTKRKKVSSRKLRHIIVQADLDESNIYAITFEECQVRLDESRTKYKGVKIQYVSKREAWLEELSQSLAANGNTSKAKILDQLKRVEHQRRTSRKLKYLRGKLSTGGFTFVTRLEGDGSQTDITDKTGIEKLLLQTHE